MALFGWNFLCAFSQFNLKSRMTKVLSAKTRYLEQKIREEYTSADVALWQGLCRQCETEVGESTDFMLTILDMAKNYEGCAPLDIIKMGRIASGQNAVNGKFMESLIKEMYGDDEEKGESVLDLTAEEELSGSYEETDEKYLDAPTSNEAYEIDGFVVPDDEADTKEHACVHGVKLQYEGQVCDSCYRNQLKLTSAPKKANADTPTGAGKVPRETWKKRNLQVIQE